MPDYQAGSASIRIGVDFRGFDRDLKAELEAREVELKIRVRPDLSSIEKMQAELNAAVKANDLHVDVHAKAETEEATAKLAAWRAREEGKDVKVKVRVEQTQAEKSAKDAKKAIEKAFGEIGKAGTLNIKALAIPGAAGVVTSLLSVADGAAKATHALGLLPAAGVAAATAMAALKIGLTGVSEAFGDYTAITKGATEIADEHLDATHGVQAAQRESATAVRDLNIAYREADRSIRDMNLDLKEQKLATEDAALGVQEAAQRLIEVQHDPKADATERARADLNYRESINRLQGQQNKTKDLAEDTKRANDKGIDGSQKVIEATNRVADAVFALDKAQRTLAQGAGPEKNLAQILARLSPNARQFVADVRTIAPAWTELRKASQDSLFAGLGGQVKTLADAQLPNLKTGLVGVNAALNTGLKATLIELSSRTNQLDFRAFLQNTTTGLENLATGAAPLTDAITKLVTVGSTFFPQFGTELAGAAQRFDNLIQRTSGDGSLKKWLQDGITSAREIVQTLEHIGSSIASIGRAASAGGTGLQALDTTTGHIAAFLKSPGEQHKLEGIFAAARQESEKWKPVLADLPQIIGGVGTAVKGWGDITMPFLRTAADLLAAHPALVQDVVTAYLAFKTIGPVLDLVSAGMKGLTTVATSATTGVKNLKTASSEAGGEAGTGKLGKGLGAVSTLIGSAAGGPWGLAIGAGITALGLLTTAHQNAAAAAQAQQAALDTLGTTLDRQTGRATDVTLHDTAAFLEKGGYLKRAESLGINTNDLVRASTGVDPGAKGAINQQLIGKILDQKGSASEWASARSTGLTDQEIAAALAGVPDAVEKYRKARDEVKTSFAEAGASIHIADLSELKNSFNGIGNSAATLAGELNNVNSDLGVHAEAARRTQQASQGLFELTDKGTTAFKDLGLAVSSVPDAKTITVNALTAEQEQKLKDLGDTVTRLPDGTIKIDLNDKQATDDIQKIVNAPYTATVNVKYVPFTQSLSVDTLKLLHGDDIGGHASGGQLPMAGRGRDGILGVHAATGTPISWLDGGEWVVKRSSAKKYGRELAQINAGTFPRHEDGGRLDDPNDPTPTQSPVPDASTVTPTPVLYPQAPLPAHMSDQQIAVESAKAAVDQANSQRNAVYGNPASTPQDKHAADIKYNQSQNALHSAMSANNGDLLSVQGIATRGAGILATGLLSGLGLENSILSSSNPWNQAVNQVYNQAAFGTGYAGQNLPTTQTTVDTTGTGTTTIPTNGQITGAGNLTVDPNLGSTTINAGTGATGSYTGDVERWRGTAQKAMRLTGFNPNDPVQLNAMLAQIGSESGGNPNAINLWDSNAAAGHPSQGLLQTIPGTFAAYRDPSLPNDITDPLANMVAALRYYRASYGSDLTSQWGHGHGYADGGRISGPGGPRSDRLPIWASHGEFMVNADSASRNLPLLEAINSGASWSRASGVDYSAFGAASRPSGAPTRDHSINFHGDTHVMNPDHLVGEMDRWNSMQAQGVLAAYA